MKRPRNHAAPPAIAARRTRKSPSTKSPAASNPSARNEAPAKAKTPANRNRPPKIKRPAKPKPAPPTNVASNLHFTHTNRVVFPDAGYTKGDVIDFYLRVADKLLPHLKDRPITLERFPEGVKNGAPQFWQKNTPAYYPPWIPRVMLATQEDKPVQYTLVNDLETLMYLVNQNVLTFHVWFSRVSPLTDADVPDFVLFDVDPHQSTFANAVAVARKLHEILDRERIANFVKTSGKSGLHVMTPWPAGPSNAGTFTEARGWAERIAQRAADALPAIATTERTISKRGQRVYVDAMQNAKGKHAVPPYVLRATPAATVSMPLEWKELNAKLTPAKWTLPAALKRIEQTKRDPLIKLTGQ